MPGESTCTCSHPLTSKSIPRVEYCTLKECRAQALKSYWEHGRTISSLNFRAIVVSVMDKVFCREIETIVVAQGQTTYPEFIFTPTPPWKQGSLWALTWRIKPWKDLSLQTAPVIDSNINPALKYQHRKLLCCSPSHLQGCKASHKSANGPSTDPAFSECAQPYNTWGASTHISPFTTWNPESRSAYKAPAVVVDLKLQQVLWKYLSAHDLIPFNIIASRNDSIWKISNLLFGSWRMCPVIAQGLGGDLTRVAPITSVGMRSATSFPHPTKKV